MRSATDIGANYHENRRTPRKISGLLRDQRLHAPPQRRPGAAMGPLGVVYPGRHEPVQGPLPRPLQARVQTGHNLPEMPPHRRHRQRRPHGVPPHLLRDAGQLQLRRLFQTRRDSLGLGVLDEQNGSICRRKSFRPRSTSTTTRRPTFGSTKSSCRRTGCSGLARTRTSGRPTPPARGPTAFAARAAKSTSIRPSARSRFGTSFSRSSTARAPAQQSWPAAKQEYRHGHGPGADRRGATGRRHKLPH